MKRTVRKEVKYAPDEWNKMISLAKESGKTPAAYIREKTVNGKIMWFDSDETFGDMSFDGNDACTAINNVAKTVNTEKEVFESDFEELEKGFELTAHYKTAFYAFETDYDRIVKEQKSLLEKYEESLPKPEPSKRTLSKPSQKCRNGLIRFIGKRKNRGKLRKNGNVQTEIITKDERRNIYDNHRKKRNS